MKLRKAADDMAPNLASVGGGADANTRTGSVSVRAGRAFAIMLFVAAFMKADGQATWRRAYGALDSDQARVVRVMDEERYAVAGSTGSFGSGASDIYLMVIDGNGDPIWSRTIGGVGVDVAEDMLVLPNGDLLIAGTTSSSGSGGYDGFLVRTSSDGTILWQRTYGGSDWDFLRDVRSSANGFLLTGQTYSLGVTGGTAWVLKVDPDGTEQWTDLPDLDLPSSGYASVPTTDGGMATVGTVNDPNGGEDVFVVKYDASNQQQWSIVHGGDSADIGRDIIQTIDGGFSVVGSTRSYSQWVEALHLKLNADGSEAWHRNWGQINDQESMEHLQLSNGEYLSVGYTRTSGGGGKDMFLLKSTVDGDFAFGRTFGGTEDEVGYGLSELSDGFICAGSTDSYGAGSTDVFVVRTALDGTTEFETVSEAFDPLSVTSNEGSVLPIHPNPTSGVLHIPARSSAGRWSLIDASGRTQAEQPYVFGTTRLDADVPSGIYLLRMVGNDGSVATTRVTIVRP